MAEEDLPDENLLEDPQEPLDTDSEFRRLAGEAMAFNAGAAARGRRTTLTAAQIEEIQRLRQAGTAVHKIAKAYHIGPARVHQILGGPPARGAGEPPAPLPAAAPIRASSRFIAAEPPTPVLADMRQIVAKKTKGRAPSLSKDKLPTPDDHGAETALERFEVALAGVRAGSDDATLVANALALLEDVRGARAVSLREYRALKRELSEPRHEPRPARTESVAAARQAPGSSFPERTSPRPAERPEPVARPPSARDRILSELARK